MNICQGVYSHYPQCRPKKIDKTTTATPTIKTMFAASLDVAPTERQERRESKLVRW
jgi:hypothetical protein